MIFSGFGLLALFTCAFFFLLYTVPFFPNISKIISINQISSKYKPIADALCNDSEITKNIASNACSYSTMLDNYSLNIIAPRKLEKVKLSANTLVLKVLTLRAESNTNFTCPGCGPDEPRNTYSFQFQINGDSIGTSYVEIKNQNTVLDLDNDLYNITSEGESEDWVLLYNTDLLDNYLLYSLNKSNRTVKQFSLPELDGKNVSDIKLDIGNSQISYTENGEVKTIEVDTNSEILHRY